MSSLRLEEPEHHEESHKKHSSCLPLLICAVILVALGVFAYVKGVDTIRDLLSGPEDYSGDGSGKVVVEVEDGDSATDIAATLYTKGVVKSQEAFIEAADDDPSSTGIQVGFYTLHRKMSADSALGLLLDPESRVSNALTIPEGLRAVEILSLIVEETDLTRSDVEAAFADTEALGLPAYADGDAEGYLFPSTYDVAPNATAAGLLKSMVDEFKKRADELDLEARAADLGVDPGDVVIVASLVQAEASRLPDMPKVASVTYNRLAIDMRLEFDSTLHYAVDSRGVINPGNLTQIDSPYNTYERTGLPPTAIDSPGMDALEAAVDPAKTDLLFFVTVNLRTGETKFAKTYAEHLRNRDEYLDYCGTSDAC